ncbi:MAG: phosphoribosylformylglycinamidine cyclo-ligase [Oscillospiraceae bacterium]|jgi:phosphoribosylformylglycinamidine cyclo-ligase|nr:phosphoribosylformylglycinamidine cyclo-ligase [Oscillospiraceae bacterium]
MNESYKNAGVDVEAGYRGVELMRESVRSTYTKGVLGDLGGFGGLFAPDIAGMSRPVLVSGTDSVGTKLKLAFQLDKHDTVGIDCVAMCANDVACAGASPLFFLDYIGIGKNSPEKVAELVKGVAEGCRQAGAALVGGETAELPGLYDVNEYDLVGFCVGMVDYDKRIDGSSIRPGDALIGLPSAGLHSNGFSLYRRVLTNPSPELALEMLTPTKIYVKDIASLRETVTVKGLAHITGGGWIENIPRMLPEGLEAVMDIEAAPVPEIFRRIMTEGNIPLEDMYNTANMGVGLVACVSALDAGKSGYPVIGKVAEGSRKIVLW